MEAAAFGRLCVETSLAGNPCAQITAAAFGRLCVETIESFCTADKIERSRLRAAVC